MFFCAKLGPQNQNVQFKPKFGIKINLNMQNSIVVFTFCVLDRKYPFWANLFQKIKIVSLSSNFVPRLIWIEKFKGLVHFFRSRPAIFVQKSIWHFDDC